MSSEETTSFQWRITSFWEERSNSLRSRNDLVSRSFSLKTRSAVHFALIVDFRIGDYGQNCVALVLKQIDDDGLVKVNAKLWLEDMHGEKFGESSVENQVFSNVGDKFGIAALHGTEVTIWNRIWESHEDLTVCCELLDLDPPIISTPAFRRNIWSMFEQENHDAVVKVGQKEFKIFKFFFMAHSSVFANMFNSTFREGITNIVEVNDVSESTMLALIKWLYTERIDNWNIVEELFAAADKYDICLLKKTCVKKLISTLNNSNAFQLFILAVKHNDNTLKEAALNKITGLSGVGWAKFTMSDEWINFVLNHTALAIEISALIRQKLNI